MLLSALFPAKDIRNDELILLILNLVESLKSLLVSIYEASGSILVATFENLNISLILESVLL